MPEARFQIGESLEKAVDGFCWSRLLMKIPLCLLPVMLNWKNLMFP